VGPITKSKPLIRLLVSMEITSVVLTSPKGLGVRLDHPAPLRGPLASADQPPMTSINPPKAKCFVSDGKFRPHYDETMPLSSFPPSHCPKPSYSLLSATCQNCAADGRRAASEPVRLYVDRVLDNVTRWGCGYGNLNVLQSGGPYLSSFKRATSPG
jgi:hypothetical protein